MSMTPPKSLMTAVGVKNKPSAIIFRLSSMLMNITNTYSAIWKEQMTLWLWQDQKNKAVFFCWAGSSDFSTVPVKWVHAWLSGRVIQTSWKCRSRLSRWSWPSPGKWPVPVSHCQRTSITEKGKGSTHVCKGQWPWIWWLCHDWCF